MKTGTFEPCRLPGYVTSHEDLDPDILAEEKRESGPSPLEPQLPLPVPRPLNPRWDKADETKQ